MLKKLQLTNFKSFAGDAGPISFAPVTILVGANGSGKSNVFDAIRFLQGLWMGLSIAEILTGKREGGHEVFPALRGGSKEVCWSGTEAFVITEEWEKHIRRALTRDSDGRSQLDVKANSFEHMIGCASNPEPRVESESLHVDGNALLLVDPKSQTDPFERSHSLAYQLARSHDAAAEHRFAAGCAMVDYANVVRFLEVRPSLMKDYVPLAVRELGGCGENLSAVVWRICQEEEQKDQYLQWLAALCAPEIEDITFVETEAGDVMVQVVEGDGAKKPITARSISDGTLRFMGILAAMFSAPEESLFLMEEIENGLHPTRVHLLVELLEQFAESRNLQIIATTHSSQVLLSLSDRALRNAVLFARNEETPGTVTRLLGDLPDFEEVTEKTRIISLNEGSTPLIPAEKLGAAIHPKLQIWLKFEGLNPTGSFKDRGMTMAVTKAVEDDFRAVMCASTGNTSASAAAYAARAGITCAVLIPEGKIALGKLSQAMIHGAQVVQIKGNFDDALRLVRTITDNHPIALVNSVNPYRIEGQKTGSFEIVDDFEGRAPDFHVLPVGNAGNITAYWKGYKEYYGAGKSKNLPRMLGFQAAGAAPIVLGHPVEKPHTFATAIDRQLTNVCDDPFNEESLKLRSNHTFVQYSQRGEDDTVEEVFDGAWVVSQPGEVKLYGRRHRIEKTWVPYGADRESQSTRVAGGTIKITSVADLSDSQFEVLVKRWLEGPAEPAVACLGSNHSRVRSELVAKKALILEGKLLTGLFE